MHDSDNAASIPANAQIVAYYPSIPNSVPRSFKPGVTYITITGNAAVNACDVLDVETGLATPQQAPGWVQMRRAAGAIPTVYCSASPWPQVRAEFARQGVPEPNWWIAAYDGQATVPPGAVAHQYIDPPGSGGHYDLSAVLDYWPGVDSAPQSASEDDMRQFHFVGLQGIEHRLGIRDNGDLIDIYGPSNGAKSQRLLVGADRSFGVDGPPNNGGAQIIDVLSTQGASAGRVIEFTQAGDGWNWTQLELP